MDYLLGQRASHRNLLNSSWLPDRKWEWKGKRYG